VITSVGRVVSVITVSNFVESTVSSSLAASVVFFFVDITSLDWLFSVVAVGSESTFDEVALSSSLNAFVGSS